MKMNKLATLFLTASLTMASGAALAADSGSGSANNGQANAAADAGAVAPDARQNIAPNNTGNSQINTGSGTTGTTNGTGNSSTTGGTNSIMGNDDPSKMDSSGMTKDEQHKNSMCKDGKCPEQSGKVDSERTQEEQKTDGTSQ